MAQTFVFAGALEDGASTADGIFTFDLELVTPAGDVLWSESQPNVVVVDGVFAIDVGASTPLPSVLPTSVQLAIGIDGDALEAIPLAQLVKVTRAHRAAVAGVAGSAISVGSVTADEAATREALAAPGGPPVDFRNLSGVSAAITDGDQGTEVTGTGDGLAVTDRTLSFTQIDGSRLANGSVVGSLLPEGSVTSDIVADGAIASAQVQNGNITRARLAEDVTSREVKTIPVFAPAVGCDVVGLTTRANCSARSCGTGRLLTCDAAQCTVIQVRSCLNTRVGELVLE